MPPITKPIEPKLYAYGEDVIVDGKNVGQAKFNSRTGAALTPNVSTTTVSNVNKIDQIPGMVSNLNKIADRGVRTDTTSGVATYADGSVAEDPSVAQKRKDDLAKLEQQRAEALKQQQTGGVVDTNAQLNLERDKINLQQDQMLADMRANLDSETKALIDSIQQNFQRKREEQTKINEKQEKGLQAGLLTGGVTGKGSRAQFTSQGSATNVMAAQENASLQKLKQLDDDERAAIAAAKAAQNAGNFEILGKQLAVAEARHQEKVQAAVKLNEKIAADNAKLQERNMEVQRDSLIGDLYSDGFTDTASIMSQLKEMGQSYTSKEITETLKNLVPPGLDDLVKTLRTNGAPQETIQAVLKSGNINDAYNAAGNWAAGGTGIIGEYNLYKAQALQAGQVPMSFNSYQDVDANRKKSIARAGAATGEGSGLFSQLDSKTANAVIAQGNQFGTSDIVKKYNNVISASNLIRAVDPNTKNPAEHQAIVYNFAKALDPDSVVREGEYATIKKYSQGLASKYRGELNQAIAGKGFLSPEAIKAIQEATDNRIKAFEPQYNNLKKQTAARINKIAGKDVADAVLLDYEQGYSGNTGDDLIKTEDQAKAKVINFGNNNIKFRDIIKTKLTETNPFTNQQYTYTDLLEIYPEMNK